MASRIKNIKKKQYKNNQLPTTTASQCRSSFFLPTIKNQKGNKREFYAKIKGIDYKVKEIGIALTELHQDIKEAIILCKKKFRKTKSGYQILYTLTDVYNMLSGRISKTELKNKIQEIRATTYFVQDPNNHFLYSSFNIFSKNEITGIEYRKNKGGLFDGQPNYYYMAEISDDYLAFENFDLQIFVNDKLRKEIINIKSAVVKHLVRYCLSQDELNKDLDDILFETGIIDDKTSRIVKSQKRKKIIELADYLLKTFSIEIKKIESTGRIGIFYKKIKQVYFQNPAIPLEFKTAIVNKNSNDNLNQIPAIITVSTL